MSWHAYRIKRGWAWIFLQKPEGQLPGECKLPTAEFFCSLTSEFDISLDKLRLSIASSDISSPLVPGRCPGSKPKHPVFQEGSTFLSEFQTHLGNRQTDLISCGSIFVDTCSKGACNMCFTTPVHKCQTLLPLCLRLGLRFCVPSCIKEN